MNKLTLLGGVLAAVTAAGSALAADIRLPTKAPPLPAPAAYDWTGFYAGLNIGYGSGTDPTTVSTVSGAGFPFLGAGTPLYGAPATFSPRSSGALGGGQIGYNIQTAPAWLAGIEADIQGSGIKDNTSCIFACGTPIVSAAAFPGFPSVFSAISAQHDIQWFGTVRGRFGYTGGPVFLYATGGLAYGSVERSGSVAGRTSIGGGPGTLNTFAGSYNINSTNAGWTLGAGVEGKVGGNWSVKAEYLYIDLGRTTDVFNTVYLPGSLLGTPGTVAAVRTDSASYRENIVRVGLNYKFGG
jgi:outer membrane immunogenic protein